MLLSKERAADYELLATMIEAGQVVPSVGRTFPLEDAREAMRLLERGEVRGKVAITVTHGTQR